MEKIVTTNGISAAKTVKAANVIKAKISPAKTATTIKTSAEKKLLVRAGGITKKAKGQAVKIQKIEEGLAKKPGLRKTTQIKKSLKVSLLQINKLVIKLGKIQSAAEAVI